METIGYLHVIQKLERVFPGAIANAEEPYGLLTVNMLSEKIIDI